MLGGLARRAFIVEKLKSEDKSLLVVDSGNLFTDGWAGANQKQSVIKARLISRAYRRMEFAAVNVGAIRVAFSGLLSPNIRTDIYKEAGKQFLVKDPVVTAREMISLDIGTPGYVHAGKRRGLRVDKESGDGEGLSKISWMPQNSSLD